MCIPVNESICVPYSFGEVGNDLITSVSFL